ncbi:MAG: hypothetical protein WAT19_10585 [Ferruginibacter sp.]
MDSYHITLSNEKSGIYYFINTLVLLMNGGLFLLLALRLDPGQLRIGAFAGGFISVIMLMLFYLQQQKAFTSFKTWMGFILLAVFWLLMNNYTAAILLTALAFFGSMSDKKKIIRFNSDGIDYPSFPAKTIKWETVEQAIIKNGVLTIDLKNNQLLQFTLNENEAASINETAFNSFCAKHSNRSW